MKHFRRFLLVCIFGLILIVGCQSQIQPTPEKTPSVSFKPEKTSFPSSSNTASSMPSRIPGILLPIRCLYTSFDKRGYPSGYYSGDLILNFNDFDPIVGHSVRDETSLQLDEIQKLGVNTIAFELRSSDSYFLFGPFTPPECNLSPALGLQYPQPTRKELENLVDFLDLLESKEMGVYLRLVNTHMEETPPINNQIWLGSILNAIKDHSTLKLVLFEGNVHTLDTDGDGREDLCGIPAEPPLWDGPNSKAAEYIRWAISYAHSLGMPYQQLSAEAVIGDYSATQPEVSGYWNTVEVLKLIFDQVGIPEEERTYALSFYERNRCAYSRIPCEEEHPHLWALETINSLFQTLGEDTHANIVLVEMGLTTNIVHSEGDNYSYEPVLYEHWTKELAMESLVWIMQNYGINGGCMWAWTNTSSMEDNDPVYGQQVKQRGVEFQYNPLKDVVHDLYTYGISEHLPTIPNKTPLEFHSITVEPAIVKNGDEVTLRVDMKEPYVFIMADLTELDDSQVYSLSLVDQGGGIYSASTTIHLWNGIMNGKKTINLWAMDFWGNMVESSVEVELQNPVAVSNQNIPNDDFSGTDLDLSRWQVQPRNGIVSVDGEIYFTISSDTESANPTIFTRWQLLGDFDIQVDFQIGEGWGTPSRGHLDGAAFGVAIDGATYHITKLRDQNEDSFFSWNNQNNLTSKKYSTATAGQYRLIRKGNILFLLYNARDGWKQLERWKVSLEPATPYLAIGSVDAAYGFTSSFDNFTINTGIANNQH